MNIVKNPRKFYMFLIFSFTLIIFVTVQVLSWSLYLNFEQGSIQAITQLEKRNLLTISDNVNNVFESASTLCKQVFVDNNVKNLMFGMNNDIYDANLIIDRLVSYSNASDYIHSIYIYSKKLDYIYCTLSNLSNSTEGFFDQEICNIIKNIKYKELKPVPRIIKNQYANTESGDTIQVYTFILFEYGINRKSADSAVIVNIKANAITSKLKALAFENNSSYLLLDGNGAVMGGSQPEKFLTDISKESFFQQIHIEKKTSGYVQSRTSHENSIITYFVTDNLGWIFIRITPYNLLFSYLYVLKNSTLAISLIILLIALVATFVTYRSIYPPIKKLVNKTLSLEEMQRDNFNSFKHEILRNFLFETTNKSIITKHFKEFNISLDIQLGFILVLLKIDRFQTFCEANDGNSRNLMIFSIGNIAQEILAASFPCEYLQTNSDHLTLIINVGKNSDTNNSCKTTDDDVIGKIRDLLVLIQSHVTQYLNLSISATISSLIHNFENIHSEYSKLLEMSNYRLIYGHACILSLPELEGSGKNYPFKYPGSKVKQLFEQLFLGKPDQAIKIYKEMTEYTKAYSYNDLMVYFNYLLLSTNTHLSKISETAVEEIGFEFYEFNKAINSVETLEEIDLKFEMLFKDISDFFAAGKDDKQDKLIISLHDYISSNYKNPNLSLQLVAEHVNKSPHYLGKVYKKFTGKSIQDQINKIRLEESIVLLVETHLSVQDICNNVGISNEKYFYIFFKKHTGFTPNEYRNRKSKQ